MSVGIIAFRVCKASRPPVVKVTYQKCAVSHLLCLRAVHLSMKHDICKNDGKITRIVGYLKKYDGSSSSAASSALSCHSNK